MHILRPHTRSAESKTLGMGPCCIHQDSPKKKEPIWHRERERDKRSYYRNWVTGFWRSRSPTCKRGTQPGGVMHSRSEGLDWRTMGVGVSPEDQEPRCPKAGENPHLRPGREREFHLPWLFILWRPSEDGMMPPTLGRAICLTQFTNSNAVPSF